MTQSEPGTDRENKTYRYTYRNGDVDEALGYLVVTPDFVAVCKNEGEIVVISPMSDIRQVKAVETIAGRA